MTAPHVCNILDALFCTSTRATAIRTSLKVAVKYPQYQHRIPRSFHHSAHLAAVRPFLLADIGEGITECQIIQWFVQPGARVAQFDKICEVQSDKASVEITSRFDGIIKKLYYEADDMARVGKPLVDIDIQSEIGPEDETWTEAPKEQTIEESRSEQTGDREKKEPKTVRLEKDDGNIETHSSRAQPLGKHATLATPAVRHLTKEHNIDISDITGSGRDGRVLKEDVQMYASARKSGPPSSQLSFSKERLEQDRIMPFTPFQKKMYEAMTRSLSIPHFLYSDVVDFTSLSKTRQSLNKQPSKIPDEQPSKLSALPFIIKAVSLSLDEFPSLNAHLDTTNAQKAILTHKGSHHIGFAVDTPNGLQVPVIHDVQNHTITSLAAEISRLGALARANKLSASDSNGATFTVSNIGSIGGLTVAPIIVSPQVAILGVGRARTVPAFGGHDGLQVVRKEECVFSWSADHRVVDGATVARCAEVVKGHLESVEKMLVKLR